MNITQEKAIYAVLDEAQALSPTSAAHVGRLLQAIAHLRASMPYGFTPARQREPEQTYSAAQQAGAFVPSYEAQAASPYANAHGIGPDTDPDTFRSGGGGNYSGAGASGSWGDSSSGDSSSSSSDSGGSSDSSSSSSSD